MYVELTQTLIFFLTGGFLVFLAITITRDNYTNRANRATGAMLFFAGLGPLALALGYVLQGTTPGSPDVSETALYDLHHIWEFFFPALIAFSWVFPIDRLRHFKFARLRYLILLPQILHVALLLFYPQFASFLDLLVETCQADGFMGLILQPFEWTFSQVLVLTAYVRTNEAVVFGSINLSYVLVAVYFLEAGKHYLTNPRLQNQTRIVLIGMRLGLTFYVAAHATTLISDTRTAGTVASYLLVAAIVGGGGAVSYAIIRHQFLNVQLIFRQSLIYTFTSAVLVGGYIMLGMNTERFLTPVFGERAEVVGYVVVLLLLLLFQPISVWIDNVIRGMFMRTRTDHRNIIERFSRDIISIFDPEKLRQTIEETLKTALLVDHVYFVLYDDSVSEYAILKSDDYQRRTVIDRQDLMLRGINLLDTPTQFADLSDYDDDSRLSEILKSLKVRVILPMKDSEHLLGFLALTTKAAGYRYSAEDFNLLGVLSNQMVSALTNARLYADSLERMRLEEEVTMAREIQVNLLPSKPPSLQCSEISAHSTPSRKVGGDFYDFIEIPDKNRLGIVIADASGKGMPAALMVAQIQAMIRSEVHNRTPIPDMMRNMNTQMAQSSSAEKFVTLFYAELDLETGELEYANGGHNYPLVVKPDGQVSHLQVGGPIIGAFPFVDYESGSVQLESEDVLFLFTDGLSEAMDVDDHEYGEDRIQRFVVDRRDKDPQTILSDLLVDVRRFDPTSPPKDDTTAIALKMTNRSSDNGQ